MTEIDSTPGDRVPLNGDVDFTMMYVAHDAFTRDLQHVTAAAGRGDGWTPQALTRWAMFEKQLHIHHTAEDNSLWPRLRDAPLESGERMVLDAMEVEHTQIDPQLEHIADAFANHDDLALLGYLEGLSAGLAAHMRHEENEALPLVEKYLGRAGWAAFGQDIRRTQGISGGAEYLPWVLEGASPENRRKVLGLLPPPARLLCRCLWEPRYRRSRA
jgi:hemerythrin-like domain-containing protein